jgi:hypothetical protein
MSWWGVVQRRMSIPLIMNLIETCQALSDIKQGDTRTRRFPYMNSHHVRLTKKTPTKSMNKTEISIIVLWHVRSCTFVDFLYLNEWDSTFLRNLGSYLPDYSSDIPGDSNLRSYDHDAPLSHKTTAFEWRSRQICSVCKHLEFLYWEQGYWNSTTNGGWLRHWVTEPRFGRPSASVV